MNPPTEQLIRDYLNRVSVAARGRLGAEDRRAFLARTREFIEQNTRALGHTDSADVQKLLAGLGDPAVLVGRERDRIAALRASPDGDGRSADSRVTRAWRRRPGRGSFASLITAQAAVVAPGEAVPVPDPAEEVPMTGEVKFQTRPISARWKPGSRMEPKPPRPRRAGIPRRLQPADRRPETLQEGPAADGQPEAGTPDQQAAGSPPPLPADVRQPRRRPEWPSLGVSRHAADEAVQASGQPDAGGHSRPVDAGWQARASGNAELNGHADSNGQPAASGPAQADGLQADSAQADGAQADGAQADGAQPGGAQPSGEQPGGTEPSGEQPAGTDAGEAQARGVRVVWASGVRRASEVRRAAGVRRVRAGRAGASGEPADGRRIRGRVGQQGAAPGDEPAVGSQPSLGLPPGSLAAIGVGARRLARIAATRARRHPLEATAVVLLGLGGLIFPPVWLMGAALALVSRVWDFRDKWIGLAVPVFLVVVGTGADVSLSGSRATLFDYAKEAWIFGGHLSRVAAVLGAVYLAWRAERGRRPPAVPPWNKPHRIG